MNKQKSKKSTKNKKLNLFSINKVFAIAIVILSITTIVQSYFIWFISEANKNNYVTKTEYLINQSFDGFYQLGTNQIVKGKDALYIPSARVTLPLSDEVLGLSASYSVEGPTNMANMSVTYNVPYTYGQGQLYNTNTVDSLFAKVPLAQSCSRQMIVLFNDDSSIEELYPQEYQVSFTKTLYDGRVVKGYVSTKCTLGAEELSNYVSQIQSY